MKARWSQLIVITALWISFSLALKCTFSLSGLTTTFSRELVEWLLSTFTINEDSLLSIGKVLDSGPDCLQEIYSNAIETQERIEELARFATNPALHSSIFSPAKLFRHPYLLEVFLSEGIEFAAPMVTRDFRPDLLPDWLLSQVVISRFVVDRPHKVFCTEWVSVMYAFWSGGGAESILMIRGLWYIMEPIHLATLLTLPARDSGEAPLDLIFSEVWDQSVRHEIAFLQTLKMIHAEFAGATLTNAYLSRMQRHLRQADFLTLCKYRQTLYSELSSADLNNSVSIPWIHLLFIIQSWRDNLKLSRLILAGICETAEAICMRFPNLTNFLLGSIIELIKTTAWLAWIPAKLSSVLRRLLQRASNPALLAQLQSIPQVTELPNLPLSLVVEERRFLRWRQMHTDVWRQRVRALFVSQLVSARQGLALATLTRIIRYVIADVGDRYPTNLRITLQSEQGLFEVEFHQVLMQYQAKLLSTESPLFLYTQNGWKFRGEIEAACMDTFFQALPFFTLYALKLPQTLFPSETVNMACYHSLQKALLECFSQPASLATSEALHNAFVAFIKPIANQVGWKVLRAQLTQE